MTTLKKKKKKTIKAYHQLHKEIDKAETHMIIEKFCTKTGNRTKQLISFNRWQIVILRYIVNETTYTTRN